MALLKSKAAKLAAQADATLDLGESGIIVEGDLVTHKSRMRLLFNADTYFSEGIKITMS